MDNEDNTKNNEVDSNYFESIEKHVKDFDLSLVKNLKKTDGDLIYPLNLIGFFSRMNFSNLNSFVVMDEKKNIIKVLTFMSYTSYNIASYGKVKYNLAMSEKDYKIFLMTYGFKNVLRWQVNINDNGYADVLVCIDIGDSDNKEK